jgi:tetratricopeptide (TPR) repeat protein
MQSSAAPYQEFTKYYIIAIDALCEIARAYTDLGRVGDARHLLHTALQLTEGASEVEPQDRLKLLLLLAKVLIVDLLFTHRDTDLLFSTILHARQIAEAAHDQQGVADALSLLGQVHYFATVFNSSTLDSPQGKYEEALAYQQQALELREALHDTRGISESHFSIGNVYERWQQYDLALQHYTKARQVAEESGHLYERTEPSRHLAMLALNKGDLDQALTYALQALSFREAARFRPFLPLDHLLLSSIYQAKGETENALLQAQKASAIASELGSKGALALALLSLGDIQVVQKEEAQARANYEQVLALAQEVQFAPTIARASLALERLTRQ